MLSNRYLVVQLIREQDAFFPSSLSSTASQTFKTAVLAQLRSEQLDIRAKYAKFSAEISRRRAIAATKLR